MLYGQKDKFDRTTAALSQMANDVRADGASAHLVISPMLRSWSTYHWTSIHERIAGAARASGFIVHDPLAALRASHREQEIRIDSLHYNAAGTAALASILAHEIQK